MVFGFGLEWIGFTQLGVLKYSTAAIIQSKIYGGATTGLFSVLQSLGAKGLVLSVSPTLITVAGTAGAGYLIIQYIRNKQSQKQIEIDRRAKMLALQEKEMKFIVTHGIWDYC